ncbi:MAG: ergothioneine biosynthesis protein EgtB [Acidimicrobiia bacterium]|jgi:iron(II)-dependent oxidoreductase
MTATHTPVSITRVVEELERARRVTLDLLGPVPEPDQRRQVSELMSPLCWDLAHIAHYEELWLLRALDDVAPTDPRFDDLYDAFRHPRRERADLPILDPAGARAFAAAVRARSLAHLPTVDFAADEPLLRDAFVYGMVVQHEHQHDETMLATIQLMGEGFAHPDAAIAGELGARAADAAVDPLATCAVPGGPVTLGTSAAPWAYDNERPAHTVELAPFAIDRYPVTNARYAEFVADGGYADPRHWTDTGWAWRTEARLAHPQFWRAESAGTWSRLRYGRREDLPGAEPVQHVCWYEADAFARWAGARLPSEPEWEAAADGAPIAAANLGHRRFAPTPIGAAAATAGRWGAEQMLGDVWEWTSSDFTPYPGFRSFPYREYSEVFFGHEYKVLRGGSWATDPAAVRTTFRNWDYPIRRQIFAGFRLAHDA